MSRHRSALRVGSLALVLSLCMGLVGAPVAGAPPDRIRVLIGFASAPGAAEEAVVRRAGGDIRYTYSLVPAIAATLPEPAVAAMKAHPGVRRVEPDLPMRAVAVDAELESAWGVLRVGAGTVHDSGNRGAGVKVAVIDSGVDYTHPELAGGYAGGYDFVSDDTEPMDVYGHGTHVAGTVCAEDNGYGVVGVAPECALYSLRVLDDNGYGYASDLIAALQWAVGHGIEVANLSLGWDRDPGATVQAAFDAAEAAGIVVVGAAGNSGNPAGKGDNVIYPAKYPSVIAVAATDSADRRASFSSTGAAVELAAPGVAVLSTWNDGSSPADPQPICTAGEGCYKYGSGTSMAAPHVAGVAALVIAAGVEDADGNGRINDEVRQILDSTADDLGALGRDPQYGYGLVNAAQAVGAVLPPPDPVRDVAVTAVDAPGSVTEGETVSVRVTVANVGTVAVTEEISVGLTDLTGMIDPAPQAIPGLDAGSSQVVTFVWNTAGTTPGTYTLQAAHSLADDDLENNKLRIDVTVSAPSATKVDSISPDRISGGTSSEMTITGSGFISGATVSFENGAGPAPTVSNIAVVDGSTITALITAKSTPKDRVWDVRVTNPDGSSAALTGGLTVLR